MIIFLGCWSMTAWFGAVCPDCGKTLIFGVNALGNGVDGLTLAVGAAS